MLNFKSAFVAGVIAGTIFQLVQLLYINSQIGVSKYSAIYGSFAAFPLFIIWMQISWLIVLMGAEISFANQNVNRYEIEYESLSINSYQKRILTLMIMNIIVKRFLSGESAVSASYLSRSMQIPVRLAREILYNLNNAGLITEISVDKPRNRLYQPAMDTSRLKVDYVLKKIDRSGGEDIPVKETSEYKKITELINDFGEKISDSSSNILIGDI